MKRREFIINTALTLGATAFAGAGFANEKFIFNDGMVVKRKFKDIEIPLIGITAKLFPMKGKKINISEVDNIVDYCMQHGANYFDTGYYYVEGKSESIISKSLSRYKRQDYILATKSPIQHIKTREDVRKTFEEQCKNCNVEYFDFYMCQNIGQNTYDMFKQVFMYDELLKLKNEGRIKYIGLSFQGTPEVLQEILKDYKWDFCQLRFNYLDWNVAITKQQYEIAQKAGVPIIAMEALRFGQLSIQNKPALAKLKEIYPNTLPSAFGLRWAASKKNVINVLAAMHSFEKIKKDINTFIHFREMDKKEEKVVNEIVEIIKSQGQIYCLDCPDCNKFCPNGVNIPTIFNIYNNYIIENDKTAFVSNYEALKKSERADKCIKCGSCEKNCPQHVRISDLLAKIDDEYKGIKKA